MQGDGSSIFFAVADLTTFEQAREICVSQGATLATISSRKEQVFVEDFLSSTTEFESVTSFWIGVEDKLKANKTSPERFSYDDGSGQKLASFSTLSSFPSQDAEPNNLSMGNCVG